MIYVLFYYYLPIRQISIVIIKLAKMYPIVTVSHQNEKKKKHIHKSLKSSAAFHEFNNTL